MKGKPIENIGKDANFGDIIMLELPASIFAGCAGSVEGNDYAVGFFSKADVINIYLRPTQKLAYNQEEKDTPYPINDIASYKILRRFRLQPEEDGIDETLSQLL
ncbi:MAG: hypothetical protein ISS93_01910 [Candidatus Aenigmarchaeota archaeon]|nr:hypothetical protein [Candidatus Aenigmarchaeota archaeon]